MIDAKYVDIEKINVGYDGNKFIDLSEIDIGFSMKEFQKILDERTRTLKAFWIARANLNAEKASRYDRFLQNVKYGEDEKYNRYNLKAQKYWWASNRCAEYAEKFK